jgi:hypothetical protein
MYLVHCLGGSQHPLDSDWFALLALMVESDPPDLAHRKFHWSFSSPQKIVFIVATL